MDSSIIQTYISSGLIGVMSAIFIARSVGLIAEDVRSAKQNRHYRQNKRAKIYRQRNRIHIIISTSQESPASLVESLESIRKNNYRKYKVSVLIHKNDPENKHIAQHWMKKYPKKDIQIIHFREENFTIMEKIMVAGRNLDGDIILPINSGATMDSSFLECANRDFVKTESLDMLVIPIQYQIHNNVSSVREFFGRVLSRNESVNLGAKSVALKANWAYRKEFFIEALHHDRLPSISSKKISSSSAIKGLEFPEIIKHIKVQKNKSPSISKRVTAIPRTLVRSTSSDVLLTLTLIGTLITALLWLEPVLFTIIWALFTLMTLLHIASDSSSNLSEKFRMSIYLPIAYALLLTKIKYKN